MKQILILAVACAFMFIGCEKEKKPSKIESHCTMNGYGTGKCSFTNTGEGAGNLCVNIRVFKAEDPGKYLESSTICSGKVDVKESKSKDFTVAGVNDLCGSSGVSWTKVCAFRVTNLKK